MSEIGAFWSYSRHDDPIQLEGLHKALEKEVAALVGWDFRIWRDRQDIATGSDWRAQIIAGLHRARIMIAVVTPRWLSSPYCREEYELFLKAEAHLKDYRIIFPIDYIKRPASLRAESDQCLVRSDLESRQLADWKPIREPLRTEGAGNPIVHERIRRLAEEICNAVTLLPNKSAQKQWIGIQALAPKGDSRVRNGKRRVVPQGPRKRPNGPARIEIASGGNYQIDIESVDLKVATYFDHVYAETTRYRFPISVLRAAVQVDALQSDIDIDSCFSGEANFAHIIVQYKRLGEWDIISADNAPLKGDCFPGGAACRLVNCRDEAGATARIVAKSSDLVVDTSKAVKLDRTVFSFSSPTKERLIAIWLREKVVERLGGACDSVVLHQAELMTEVVDPDGGANG